MRRIAKVTQLVQDVRFANGDVSGWQLGAAWQANKVGGAKAADPNDKYRKNFLASGEGLKKTLASTPVGDLTPGEKANVDKLTQQWDTYFQQDVEIAKLWAQNTPAGVAAGDDYMSKNSLPLYGQILGVTDDLAKSLDSRSAAAADDAAAASTVAKITMPSWP